MRFLAVLLVLLSGLALGADTSPVTVTRQVGYDEAYGAYVDSDHRLFVQAAQNGGMRATYGAAAHALTSAANATDIFTVTGSSSKTIRITRVLFSSTEGSNGIHLVRFIKRSTADSGGTSSAITAVPYDSASAAATATVLAYTANPTLGTAVGDLAAFTIQIPATNLNNSNYPWEFAYGTRPAQAIVLRGTEQVFAVNLDATTITNGSFNISVEWTEE